MTDIWAETTSGYVRPTSYIRAKRPHSLVIGWWLAAQICWHLVARSFMA